MLKAPPDHVGSFMKNITTAMDTVFRTRGMPGFIKLIGGRMWYMTACKSVNWTWVTFSVTMITLEAIFLLLVHLESRGVESERLWESSILAMLFCEMNDRVTDEARPVWKRQPEEVAASSIVSLRKYRGSLRFGC